MSRVCQLTGVKVMFGNNVSHSKRKTRRVFLPNLHNKKFLSYMLQSLVSFRVTPCAMKTVDVKGGIDEFLLNAKDEKLSKKALKMKKTLTKMSKSLDFCDTQKHLENLFK